MTSSKNLCSVSELNKKRKDNDNRLRVLDSSWYLPSEAIDAQRAFNKQHISGATFFHIDSICDQKSILPHMLPSADEFAAAVENLGINNDSDVIIYDSAGLFSAARVWWMFKVFGHASVRVLNGGLPAWIADGGTLSDAAKAPVAENYNARLNVELVKTKSDLIENAQTHAYSILDARPTARFLGQAPEPRPGLPSGHMPHSVSLPFGQLLDNGYLKPADQLRDIFLAAGIDDSSSIITSCGSGVTAAIITLALAEAGLGMHSLYDGSWTEWASSKDTLILTE